MKPSPESLVARRSHWRSRFLAIGFGGLLLIMIEGACRLLGLGEEDLRNDPFVGFSAVEPLFALNPLNNRYETRPERGPYFIEDGFSRKKAPGAFRIFVFGGSTVQGRPYSIETAFPKWLQINLKTAFPNRSFEAVNCGGISYASYRLMPIIEECLAYEPDLFIVCTGQNEFLESRTYGSLKRLARPLAGPVKAIRSLATYRALDRLHQRFLVSGSENSSTAIPTLKMEVDALLDYRRGLEAYHRDPEWQNGVITHFQDNFRRIDAMAKKAGVPLLALIPPFNLKDCPPFKSTHGNALAPEQKKRWDALMDQANRHYRTDTRKAAHSLRQAIELDPQYALAHYSLGQCYLAQGEFAKAHSCFQRALEEDVCPLRILPSMRQFIHQYSKRKNVLCLDLQALLKQHTQEAVMGGEILVDHIHPSIRGHQLIAEEIAQFLFDEFLERPTTDAWQSERSTAYQAHFKSLDELYFTHGSIRLENLRAWTQGQADGPPIEMHVPIGSEQATGAQTRAANVSF